MQNFISVVKDSFLSANEPYVGVLLRVSVNLQMKEDSVVVMKEKGFAEVSQKGRYKSTGNNTLLFFSVVPFLHFCPGDFYSP